MQQIVLELSDEFHLPPPPAVEPRPSLKRQPTSMTLNLVSFPRRSLDIPNKDETKVSPRPLPTTQEAPPRPATPVVNNKTEQSDSEEDTRQT